MSDVNIIRPKPTLDYTIQLLKNLEIPITSVIQVGIDQNDLYFRDNFSDLRHLLIDVDNTKETLVKENYEGLNYEFINVALGSANEEKYLTTKIINGSDNYTVLAVTDSQEELNESIISSVPCQIKRFDTLELSSPLESNFLLKINTDGGENEIFDGFGEFSSFPAVVVIEAVSMYMGYRLTRFESAGYTVVGIGDLCYYGPLLQQCAVTLLRNDIIEMLRDQGSLPNWINFEKDKWFDLNEFYKNATNQIRDNINQSQNILNYLES